MTNATTNKPTNGAGKPPAARAAVRDMSWEKELAPKVTRGQIAFVAVLYGVWTLGLLYLAIDRWYGSLQ